MPKPKTRICLIIVALAAGTLVFGACENPEDFPCHACDPLASCEFGESGPRCVCLMGSIGNGRVCRDINGCASNPCFADVTCTDVPAPGTGFICGECPPGFEGSGVTCTDIDGCVDAPCLSAAGCVDIPAPGVGYICGPCPSGTAGDGITCTEIDGCANAPCFPGLDCTDVPAPGVGFVCDPCPAGFEGDGITCKDIDGCRYDPCPAGVTCTDVPAPAIGHTCGPCPLGYDGDGYTCTQGELVPIPYTVETIDGSLFRVYTLDLATSPIRVVCEEPCTIDESYLWAEYESFTIARHEVLELTGIEPLDWYQPVDLHVASDSVCGPVVPRYAAWATSYTSEQREDSSISVGGIICLFAADRDTYTRGIDFVRNQGQRGLKAHEFTHLLLYRRSWVSYEDLTYSISFQVDGRITSPCDDFVDWAMHGRLVFRLCQDLGFEWADLKPSLVALDELYAQRLGYNAHKVSLFQYRSILSEVLGGDTMDAFLAAGYSANMVGDSAVLDPAGGRVEMLRGRVILDVPMGAVDAPLAIKSEYPETAYPHQRLTDYTRFDLVPFDLPRHGESGRYFDFSTGPVMLTLAYEPEDLAEGVSEDELVLLCREWDPNTTTSWGVVPGSYVDTTTRVVVGEIGWLGLYAVGPAP